MIKPRAALFNTRAWPNCAEAAHENGERTKVSNALSVDGEPG